MKKIISTVIISIYAILNFGIQGQQSEPQPVSSELKESLVDSIVASYYDWNNLSLSGKLSSPMLPATGNVKIYMEKDALILISVSAPLVGEVARIEIDKDAVLAVNKYKNKYATIQTDMMETLCPGGLTALQNLLLGRINILGEGALNAKNAGNVNIFDTDPTQWIVLPEQDYENAPYVYLYTVDRISMLLSKFIVLTQSDYGNSQCEYNWGNKGNVTIDMSCDFNGKTLEASLRLNEPDRNPKKLDRLELTSKYKKTDLKGLLR